MEEQSLIPPIFDSENTGLELDYIGNPTDKRVGFFKITLINELVRCDFLNQPKWSE